MSAAELPQLTYDNLSVGKALSETTMAVSREMIANYGKAVHNKTLVAQADAPPGTPLCDASLVILFGIARRALRMDGRLPPGGILAGQDYEVERPLRAGETVHIKPSVVAKYEKRGRRYVQLHCELEDDSKRRIGAVDSFIIWAPGSP